MPPAASPAGGTSGSLTASASTDRRLWRGCWRIPARACSGAWCSGTRWSWSPGCWDSFFITRGIETRKHRRDVASCVSTAETLCKITFSPSFFSRRWLAPCCSFLCQASNKNAIRWIANIFALAGLLVSIPLVPMFWEQRFQPASSSWKARPITGFPPSARATCSASTAFPSCSSC